MIQEDSINTSLARYSIPPRKLIRRQRRKIRRLIQSASIRFESWDEDRTEPAEELLIDAATYNVEPVFDLKRANQEQIAKPDKYLISPKGAFAYQNRVLHAGFPLTLYGHGNVLFSDDVTIPMLIDMYRDRHGDNFGDEVPKANRVYHGNVWMSLTPNEMISLRDGVEAAKGTVVIGGLGLGWFLGKVCEKESVDRVIVVESSQELLDWYGYDICKKHPKVTDVICDDIYNQLDRHGGEAVHLLDIWPTQICSNTDLDFIRAKRRLGERLWGWGFNSRLSSMLRIGA